MYMQNDCSFQLRCKQAEDLECDQGNLRGGTGSVIAIEKEKGKRKDASLTLHWNAEHSRRDADGESTPETRGPGT